MARSRSVKIRPKGTYALYYSSSADLSSPIVLDGATVNGPVYVFVSPTAGVDSVTFTYGSNTYTDTTAPFEINGGTPVNFATALGSGGATYMDAVLSVGSNVYTVTANFTAIAEAIVGTQETLLLPVSVPLPVIQASSGSDATVTKPSVGAPALVGASAPLGFAGPNTTGTVVRGHTLTVYNGDYAIPSNGSVVDRDITGKLSTASNSTASDCRVRKFADLFASAASTVEYCDIGPITGQETIITDPDLRRSVQYAAATLRRCDIRGCVDGAFVWGAAITIEDCWLHGQWRMASDPNQGGGVSHCDPVQIAHGSGHRITRCRLDALPYEAGETFDQWNTGAWPLPDGFFAQAGQPSATQGIIIKPGSSSQVINDVVIRECRITGYVVGHLLLLDSNGSAKPTNVSFIDNVIDVRGISRAASPNARKVLGIGTGVANPTWTGNTLATDYTAVSGNFYAAGSTISLSLATTPMVNW